MVGPKEVLAVVVARVAAVTEAVEKATAAVAHRLRTPKVVLQQHR